MKFSAKEIASLTNGKIEGNPDITVTKLCKIEEGTQGGISFLANPAYIKHIYTTDASVVILDNNFTLEHPVKQSCTLIWVDNAYSHFAKLLEIYDNLKKQKTGIEQPVSIDSEINVPQDIYVGAFTVINKNVTLGKNVKIYPNCFIGENVSIGDNTILHPGVKIYHDCIIGNDCTIHAGSIIGADGFGFAPNSENVYKKVPQIGNVIIHDHVDIGANTTIDRATIGSTIIEKGVKLDNLIQIAHNVTIGENTVIAAQTAVAGSAKIGKNCMIGGQVGITGHIEIANDTKISAQSGIGRSSKKDGEILQGSPAFDIQSYRRSYVHFKQLPQIIKRIDQLEKK